MLRLFASIRPGNSVGQHILDPSGLAPPHQGTNSVEEGAEIIVRMASIGAHGPSGGFFDQAGPVVW
nr:hypothetical protein [Streptomyces sp. BE133]